MNERENELFEAELRRLKPARLPDNLRSRLGSACQRISPPLETRQRPEARGVNWARLLRWLAPATVALVAFLALSSHSIRGPGPAPAPAAAASTPALKADQVEIDRQLLDSFEAVASLPDAEPVRFRFQQWMEAVTVRDSASGLEVVHRTPRIEVVPIGYASY